MTTVARVIHLIAMSPHPHLRSIQQLLCALGIVTATATVQAASATGPTTSAAPKNVTATVTVSPDPAAPPIAPLFLGLSYESRAMLPENGKYYFDENDENLVRTFRTLGIRSLRVGANAVDDPRVDVPDTKAIDALFKFAKKTGTKVIYSLRLKKGDPADAARLAKYIDDNYRDTLDCYSIGNEPDFYFKTYEPYRDAYKPIYEAVIKAVPDAKLEGPATSRKIYSLEFADEFFPGGHFKMVATHNYPLGHGREAEKDPPATRARFVSNKTHATYQRIYDGIVKPLADKGIAYRMDETNSCFRGGAKDCSDAYASTLWVLDYLNWWAGRHIQGLTFHTGDTVNGFPPMVANYAVFIHKPDGKELEFRPVSYGILAFSQAARGTPMTVKLDDAAAKLDFTAYAYQADDGRQSLILLNKTHGDAAPTVTAVIQGAVAKSRWQSMELNQEAADLAAKTGVTLGDGEIDPKGNWDGKWTDVAGGEDGNLRVTIQPTSAVLLRVGQ